MERVPCKAHGRILSDGVERGSSQEREQMQMPMQMQMPTRERGFRCVCVRVRAVARSDAAHLALCGSLSLLCMECAHPSTGLWLSNVCRLVPGRLGRDL